MMAWTSSRAQIPQGLYGNAGNQFCGMRERREAPTPPRLSPTAQVGIARARCQTYTARCHGGEESLPFPAGHDIVAPHWLSIHS
jgi:hypothetical protein